MNYWADGAHVQRAKAPIKKAFKYINQIPDKDKYLVRFVKTLTDSGWGKAALNILREMEKVYPNDKEMIYNIGDSHPTCPAAHECLPHRLPATLHPA